MVAYLWALGARQGRIRGIGLGRWLGHLGWLGHGDGGTGACITCLIGDGWLWGVAGRVMCGFDMAGACHGGVTHPSPWARSIGPYGRSIASLASSEGCASGIGRGIASLASPEGCASGIGRGEWWVGGFCWGGALSAFITGNGWL